MLENYSKHQQGIIKRYYENFDAIQAQRLADLVAELFLASDKKKEKLWQTAVTCMEKLNVPRQQIDQIVGKKDVTLLASLVKEIYAK